jgi:hypothetical protein
MPTNIIAYRNTPAPAILEPRTIVQCIKYFNPDARPEQDFTDTWRFICLHTRKEKLTEEEYIHILNYCLVGEAHRLYTDLVDKNKSLKDILAAFTKLYTKRRTVNNDMHDINNFVRRAREPIFKAMQRAEILAERLESLYSEAAWPEIKQRILKSLLFQIIPSSTRKFVEKEEQRLNRIGIDMDFDALINLVEDREMSYSEIPTTDVHTSMNACSGTIKSNIETPQQKYTPSYTHNDTIHIKEKVVDLETKLHKLSAAVYRQRTRSPSPYTRPPPPPITSKHKEELDKLKGTSRPQSPNNTYAATKTVFTPPAPPPTAPNFTYGNKSTPPYQSTSNAPQARNGANYPYDRERSRERTRPNDYNRQNYNRTPSREYRDPSRDRYRNTSRTRDYSRDNRRPSYDKNRSSKYNNNRNYSKDRYTKDRDYSKNRYANNRNYSNDRHRNSSYDKNRSYGANRSRSRTRNEVDENGQTIKVTINSNENICDRCKSYMHANSICVSTGLPHENLN